MGLVLGVSAGFVTEAPVADPEGSTLMAIDGYVRALKVTSSATAGKITEIGVWINGATEEGDLSLGIYSHDSGNNRPDELLDSVVFAKGTTVGWKSNSVSFEISSERIYWLAVNCEDTVTSTRIDYTATGGEKYDALVNSELPFSWGTSAISAAQLISIYAVWEEAEPTGTNTQINIGDSWKEIVGAQINIGDTWKEVVGMQVNIGDSWKEVF